LSILGELIADAGKNNTLVVAMTAARLSIWTPSLTPTRCGLLVRCFACFEQLDAVGESAIAS
jgi:hypothetical protein